MRQRTIFVLDDEWGKLRGEFQKIAPIINEHLNREGFDFRVSFKGMEFNPNSTPSLQVGKAIEGLLGVHDGDISVCAVIADMLFETPLRVCRLIDAVENHPVAAGQTSLDDLLGSGLPIIVFSKTQHLDEAHAVGKANLPWLPKDGADLRDKAKNLSRLLVQSLRELPFNDCTLEVENDFARHYDEVELKSYATRATILWENERVLQAFQEARARVSGPLRVLDIGCGTGRFEELLLKHNDTAPYIDKIVAVDFAPQYLVEANQRLRAVGVPDLGLRKIAYSRRIAEKLRMPEGYFDLVLCAFGVPCFSRYTTSIPEAVRALAPHGVIVFTAYNDESLNFEFEELLSRPATGDRRSFFAANIDRNAHTMTLPGQPPFPCATFTPENFIDLLRPHVHVAPEASGGVSGRMIAVETFPVLHGCAAKGMLTSVEQTPKKTDAHAKRRGSPEKPSYSYMDAAIEALPGFSHELYRIDREMCRIPSIHKRGHYINIIATKRS